MPAYTRFNNYQIVECQFGIVNNNGVCIGQLDPDNLVNDSTSSLYRATGVISANLPTPTSEKITFTGNSTLLGEVIVPPIDLGESTITLSVTDNTLYTLFTGHSEDTTTVDGWSISALNTLTPNLRRIMCVISVNLLSQDTATQSTKGTVSYIIPSIQVRGNIGELNNATGENPITTTLTIAAQKANRFPGGNAFGSNQSWYNNEEIMYWVATQYPLSYTAYIQDGVTTTYNTAYQIVDATVTDGNQRAMHTQNGTITAPSSMTASSGAVTLGAAGTAGQIAASFYETDNMTAAA